MVFSSSYLSTFISIFCCLCLEEKKKWWKGKFIKLLADFDFLLLIISFNRTTNGDILRGIHRFLNHRGSYNKVPNHIGRMVIYPKKLLRVFLLFFFSFLLFSVSERGERIRILRSLIYTFSPNPRNPSFPPIAKCLCLLLFTKF